MTVAFRAFTSSFKVAGPSYAAGTTGTFAKLAIVTAPRFKETSSTVLVPRGIFRQLLRILIVSQVS